MSTTDTQPRFNILRIARNCAIALILGFLIIVQLGDVVTSRPKKDLKVQFFDEDVTVPVAADSLPPILNEWTLQEYSTTERTRGSDLGQRSDTWQYQAPFGVAVASLDQPFPGWHELTVCYCNTGWKLGARTLGTESISATGEQWDYVEADYSHPSGEHGFLVFSFFDIDGNPVAAPESWGGLESMMLRTRNRMSHQARQTLFGGEAYQVQVFVATVDELSDGAKHDARTQFMTIREDLRSQFCSMPKGRGN